ncbi:hypothetical protein [Streptococcus salivarius]|jgi:hypothetical protein|uniref:Uncharacterized protein n=1 Tax=Streptococcus salivarius TaxID=1304 RepID=A0A074IYX8_STRSL|nr:hypothetical protein [Streptococcus salivarius]KEO45409.1 hypothetical protein DL07_01675 [Streptococcus salivarius]KEO46096.1 hypothetical protein DL08_07540 [Streptococcus salivarius]
MKLYIILSLVLLALSFLGMVAVYQHCCNRKDKISKFLKDYIVHIIIVILLYSLFSPIILYFFGVFKEGRALYNSDILGYYGALIGGGVTVLGIYWTFNYERLMSEEERKEDNLPILQFSIEDKIDSNVSCDLKVIRGMDVLQKRENLYKQIEKLQGELFDLVQEELKINGEKSIENGLVTNSEIKINDKKQEDISEIINNILEVNTTFSLNIRNIGLQTAILSSIQLCSQNDISSKIIVLYKDSDKHYENLLQKDDTAKIEMFAVAKEKVINLKIDFSFYDNIDNVSEDINGKKIYGRGDYFLIDFTDVYLNRYRYKLPIELENVNNNYSVCMNQKQVPVLPERIVKP